MTGTHHDPPADPAVEPGSAPIARVAALYGMAALALVAVLRVLVVVGVVPGAILRPLGFILVAAFPLALVVPWVTARSAEPEADAAADAVTGPRPDRTGLRAAVGITALVVAAWMALATPRDAADVAGPGRSPPEPRVLVLPLIDLDGRGDRYFADGVTDELTAALAAVEGLQVRGRVSAAARIDVNRDAGEIAQDLGAAAALDGTVRRTGRRLRLTVRLLDAATDSVLWSASRDTSLAGLFDVRDDVVRGVVGALGLPWAASTERRLARRRTSVEALDLYMLGRFRWAAGPGGDLAEAASYYHLAIEADSGFAPAWTALAETYATLPRFTRFPPDAARTDGAAAARTALQLEPDAGGAHAALGEILYLYERDWTGARSHLDRAIALDPGDGGPLDRWCEMSLYRGETGDARERCAAARRLDPLAFRPAWLEARLDRAASAGEAGLARLDSLMRAFPDFEPLAADLALARLAATGEPERARRDLARWFGLLGGSEVGDSLAAVLGVADAGPAGGLGSAAVRAALDRVETGLRPDAAHLAALLSLYGMSERAEDVALAALENRSPGSLGFGVLPEFAALRERTAVRDALVSAGLPHGD